MTDNKMALKHRYHFSDFLYYTTLLVIPIITGLIAILEKSGIGAIIFLLISAGAVSVILRLFCSHCPHYCRDEKRLNCIFFWGLPKLFKQRPGQISARDKLISFIASAILLLYPFYWLLQRPGLFIIYVLSIVAIGASVRRNECPRCIYAECPANIAERYTGN